MYHGFGSVAEMSASDCIDEINSSGADLLVAALGAKKGQMWLLRNHRTLRIPIRAHLGATLNFQAGTVRRAPSVVRKLGLEWLWRIKEEPHLWSRYGHDGIVLLRLALTRVLPFTILTHWLRWRLRANCQDLSIYQVEGDDSITLVLSGAPIDLQMHKIRMCFGSAGSRNRH